MMVCGNKIKEVPVTPFGKFMRNVRLEKGLLLKDVAHMLEVTSAYLSALEHGKKGVPNAGLLSKLENHMKLTTEQKKEMRRAAAMSITSVSISSKASPFAFETANAFARKLPNLSEQQLRRIKGVLEDED
jgi:transcriptional regulator with XRE-family HTH domain